MNEKTKRQISSLGFRKGSICESIITTYNENRTPNAAPMGISTLDESTVVIKVHTSSDTYRNLSREKACVINVIYDPLLYIKTAVLGKGKGSMENEVETTEVEPAKYVKAPFLTKASAFIEVELESHEERIKEDSLGRYEVSRMLCRVVNVVVNKYPVGINRGLYAAIELAILLSRGQKEGIGHYLEIMRKTLCSEDYRKAKEFIEDFMKKEQGGIK